MVPFRYLLFCFLAWSTAARESAKVETLQATSLIVYQSPLEKLKQAQAQLHKDSRKPKRCSLSDMPQLMNFIHGTILHTQKGGLTDSDIAKKIFIRKGLKLYAVWFLCCIVFSIYPALFCTYNPILVTSAALAIQQVFTMSPDEKAISNQSIIGALLMLAFKCETFLTQLVTTLIFQYQNLARDNNYHIMFILIDVIFGFYLNRTLAAYHERIGAK